MKEERRADKRTEDERERSKHRLPASRCDPGQSRTHSREARESGTSASARQGPFGLVLRDQRWPEGSLFSLGIPGVHNNHDLEFMVVSQSASEEGRYLS